MKTPALGRAENASALCRPAAAGYAAQAGKVWWSWAENSSVANTLAATDQTVSKKLKLNRLKRFVRVVVICVTSFSCLRLKKDDDPC